METHSDDFRELRRLLALKRHEQPPPRYFNEFSGRVIDRLRTPEVLPALTWWQRLGLDLSLPPAAIGALGVIISGLLLFGAVTSAGKAPANAAALAMNSSSESAWLGTPMLASITHRPVTSLDEIPASTAPVFGAPASSPFSTLGVQASRVNWALGVGQN